LEEVLKKEMPGGIKPREGAGEERQDFYPSLVRKIFSKNATGQIEAAFSRGHRRFRAAIKEIKEGNGDT